MHLTQQQRLYLSELLGTLVLISLVFRLHDKDTGTSVLALALGARMLPGHSATRSVVRSGEMLQRGVLLVTGELTVSPGHCSSVNVTVKAGTGRRHVQMTVTCMHEFLAASL